MALSLRAKTVLGTALIEGVLLLVLVITAHTFMKNIVNDNLEKRAVTAVNLFNSTTKNAAISFDIASLESIVQEVITNPDIKYARVLDANGRIFAQAGDEPALARIFSEDKSASEVDDAVFDVSSTIVEAGRQYGSVQLGIEISGVQASLNQITQWTASIALVEMFLVALFSFGLGTVLTKHLGLLRTATKKVADSLSIGRFEAAKVEVVGDDELADVARDFNALIENLALEHETNKAFSHELKELNNTLEQRVERRTIALETAQKTLAQTEKMASIGHLTAGVAHELNNPIGFVKSNLGILRKYVQAYIQIAELAETLTKTEKFDPLVLDALRDIVQKQDIEYLSEDVIELLDDSGEGLDRVIEIVKGLKGFSRLDKAEMASIDLNECITNALKLVSLQIESDIQLDTELSPDLPRFLANEGRLSQVLINLVVNASHAFDQNAQDAGTAKITISTKVLDAHAVIKIHDNGCGICEQDIAHIFNPFFTTKPVGQGTGLGLSISYEIIQEHNGSLTVESEVGKGSTFSIKLPFVEQPAD